ncbi:MAG: hypothetical protein KIS66_01090 [Fimbriimonadaceae bacterium]|nr:hypothetical protein [Fimbriimonadaceae bacterium]
MNRFRLSNVAGLNPGFGGVLRTRGFGVGLARGPGDAFAPGGADAVRDSYKVL